MTTSHQDDAARARYAIQNVLDGNPPNGTKPEDCGPWKDPVAAIFQAWDTGGAERARAILPTLIKAAPGLDRLLSEGAAPAKKEEPAKWGGILPFHSASLPPFPLDIFPPWLREYCEAVTETMQTPPDLAGMLALSVLSAACGGLVEVRAKPGWDEPVNVYTVAGLPPGTGKSPVFRAMTMPISMYERQQLEKVEKDIMDAEARRDVLEQRIRNAKSKAGKAPSEHALRQAYNEIDELNDEMRQLFVPVRPKLIVDDATPESVASILAEQGGRLAVLSSEGDIFAIMAGRYSAGAPNIGVYKKGHAGDELRVDRKNRSEIVRRPAITMGITTQPEVMRTFGQNAIFRSEGLLARFFYALPKSLIGNRKADTDPIPDHIRSTYYHRILTLLENVNSRYSRNTRNEESDNGNNRKNIYIDNSIYIYYVNLSNTSRDLFLSYKAWTETRLGVHGDLHTVVDWGNKLPGAVLRVAGLLHMAQVAAYNSYNPQNSESEIDDATMQRAIRFADYLIPHAQAAYAEIGADPSVEGARSVLRWIEKTGLRSFAKQECYQGCKGTLKRADDLNPVLSLLCDHGYLREIEAPERIGPGRKAASSYEVNPVFFDGSYNSYNSQNEGGASYQAPEPPPHGYREIGGYEE
jgi:replicative DNA helicase